VKPWISSSGVPVPRPHLQREAVDVQPARGRIAAATTRGDLAVEQNVARTIGAQLEHLNPGTRPIVRPAPEDPSD
jgi:hypothetical protein